MRVLEELRYEASKKRAKLETLLNEGNLWDLHSELNKIASDVGFRRSIAISINFPEQENMQEVIGGERNVSIIVDPHRKVFAPPMDMVKQQALRTFKDAKIEDFQNAEGFHVIFSKGRISVFPGSVHIWCNTKDAENFVEYLLNGVFIH